MAIRMRAAAVVLVTLGTVLVGATRSEAQGDPAAPTLTPDQQAKLKKIQAKFADAKTSWSGYGLEKSAEFCGANIPMEIHPSTVAFEKMEGDRTGIPDICHGAGSAIAYTCGYSEDADPVVKEMIRSGVKRVVCKYTKNADDVDQYNYQKWALENGTLTFTCLAGRSCGNLTDNGIAFLKKNVKQPGGLSIGGQLLKRQALADLSPRKSTLLKLLKDECGISPSIAIDDKLAEHYSYNTGHNPTSACEAGLQSVYNFCGRSEEFERRYNVPALKAAFQKNLKGVSCVYSDTEAIAWKPGGILELGGSKGAARPKWEGRMMMSIHDYYMSWMNGNLSSISSQPASPKPAPKPAPKKR